MELVYLNNSICIINRSMSDSKKISFREVKSLGILYHPDSTLVFKSKKEKVVIGSYVNKEFVPLNEDAIQLAEKWNFPLDPELLQDENGNEYDNDNDVGEENQSEPNEGSGEDPDPDPELDPDPSPLRPPVTTLPTTVSTTLPTTLPTTVSTPELEAITSPFMTELEAYVSKLKLENQRLQQELDAVQSAHNSLETKFKAIKSLFQTS